MRVIMSLIRLDSILLFVYKIEILKKNVNIDMRIMNSNYIDF